MELSASEHAELATLWQTLRSELRRRFGDSTYELWLSGLEPVGWDGATLRLHAPPDKRAWIGKRFGKLLDGCARAALGPEASVLLDERGGPERAAEPSQPAQARLNPRYRFEQFVIGEGNRLAHAAALAVAEMPGQAYNPLFLHAPPGLGKTHLLHAIGNYMSAFGAGTRVRYTTVEAFTNHFISALGHRALDGFKHTYRNVDVLLIDDVQFLAHKAKTEEEFFHTFNALYDNGRQLVLTCDRLPTQLAGIADRLRERFEAGLVADIRPPDLHTRLAILRKRVALDNIPLQESSVLELVAQRIPTNVRALEGALIRIVAYHSLTGRLIDADLASTVLDTIAPPAPQAAPPSIESIHAAVTVEYDLEPSDLGSPSRAARVVWPRQVAIHLCRELTGASLPAIGDAFGGRNHATVLHACKRVAQVLLDNPDEASRVQSLRTRLANR